MNSSLRRLDFGKFDVEAADAALADADAFRRAHETDLTAHKKEMADMRRQMNEMHELLVKLASRSSGHD